MPLASLVHWLSSTPASSTLSTLALWGSLAALVVGLRAWSKGYVCKEERGLAAKTFLLTDALIGSQHATDALPGRDCPAASPATLPALPRRTRLALPYFLALRSLECASALLEGPG
ncbi:hypothetical protein BJY59DRAFT_700463 [Rhodotorula toruloides]